MKRLQIVISCAVALLIGSQSARADVWAYTSPNTGVSPLQAWTGSLGLDFNVNTSIYVTALGAFNSKGDGKVNSGTILVGIFNRDTGVEVTPTAEFSSGGGTYTLSPGGFDITQSIAKTLLSPGEYSIVAVGFSGTDPNGNDGNGTSPASTVNNGGGLISFVGTARYTFKTDLVLPEIIDSGPDNRYDAGTFAYTATPEPAFYGVMALGLSGLFVVVRRRRA
jgi:hypothetical protein